jgi:iron complex outermembrane recepter protein
MLGVLFSSQLFSQEHEYTILPDSQEVAEIFIQEVQISGKKEADQATHKSSNCSTEDHLENINGLHLIRRGNYAAEPSYRGLNSSQTSVTIDGMKIFGACTDKMDPVTSYVAPDNLAKAKVNAVDDCHSSCNIASVDLQTKALHLKQQKPSGFLRSGYISNTNGHQLAGEINYGNAKRAIRIQSFYTKSNNYIAGGGDEIKFTQFSKWNTSVYFKQKIGSNAVIDVKYISDRAKDIGYPALPMDVARADGDIVSVDYKQYLKGSFFKSLKVKAYGNSITM